MNKVEMIKASTKKERGRHIMMLFKTDPRFDNSALTLNLQTETNTENTYVTRIFQSAKTLKDITSVFAKVDMNINVEVNIPPSTSRYAN